MKIPEEKPTLENLALWLEIRETQRQLKQQQQTTLGGIWIVILIELVVIGMIFFK